MNRRSWVRLDNASNIFLAARSDVDTKVFRLSAEMDEPVDPGILQEALDATFERFPLYHAVLRRGVFWYYLQDSDLRPRVEPERGPTCAPLYQAGRLGLLFRVMHHRRRIILEVFHALSDGTGGLWFLTDLLTEYAQRTLSAAASSVPGDSATDPAPGPSGTVPPAPEIASFSPYELEPDSFAHYFRRRRRRSGRSSRFADAFASAAAPAPLGLQGLSPSPSADARADGSGTGTGSDAGTGHPRRIHRVRGTRTPDLRTRAIELTMPTSALLSESKASGASPTMFLTALFLDAVRASSGGLGARRTLSASVPVNLRQFFPSTSARNFFATIRIAHTFDARPGSPADEPGAISRSLEAEFRPQANARALAPKVARFIRVERSPLLRIVPRPLKDLVLGWVNARENRRLSVAVSNLGRVVLPEPAASQVGRVLFQVSAVRPQFCAISHGEDFTVTFTSPFTQTDHVREFVRSLTDRGVPVRVAAARVTEHELQEVAG
ncbi:alcohol acetyltransferase [Brachybacterium endophyticum]|uniref:Alcohol acetyltransferase n=1 Tax=Brachybacterium endophyticum TaxID=2182385 RepID=A0A2U2RHT6_9MICO|nr:alcohol acetyltransferase [Brachybacterium endophyticum]PWH05414.1 alcohol acetyltransferase [Brachybacterium endophyticum]